MGINRPDITVGFRRGPEDAEEEEEALPKTESRRGDALLLLPLNDNEDDELEADQHTRQPPKGGEIWLLPGGGGLACAFVVAVPTVDGNNSRGGVTQRLGVKRLRQ